MAEKLKIDYSRFIEVEAFTKFGVHMEEETARLIRRGERLREMLKQARFHPFDLGDQVAGLIILDSGVLDTADIASVREISEKIIARMKNAFPDLMDRIRRGDVIGARDMETLRAFITKAEG
jgi:F-type H+-transporting ATPase subunit alpha